MTHPWPLRRAFLVGTLLVGTLDILDALIFFGLRGVPPIRIFHSIAGGLLGRDAARAGGIPTALLGGVLHYCIAFCIVAVFVLASRRLPWLVRHPWLSGPPYGIAVYAVMSFVVLPLSALDAPVELAPPAILANGLLIHVFGVGLPSAWVARRATGPAGFGPRLPAAEADLAPLG
jgi:hypothetical protein